MYLFLDIVQQHYAAILPKRVQGVFRKMKNSQALNWCHKCVSSWWTGRKGCLCDTDTEPAYKKQKTKCRTCGVYDCGKGCPRTCQICMAVSSGNGRCLFFAKTAEAVPFWKKGDPEDPEALNPPYKLWVYDLESAIVRIPGDFEQFKRNLDGSEFVLDDGNHPQIEIVEQAQHQVNLVVFRNVFDETAEATVLDTPDCLALFIRTMLADNNGRNICIAHNGSGYDTRLVFEAALKLDNRTKMDALTKGTKFLQFAIGNTVFRDSMLHMPGSLASLAKGFFPNGIDGTVIRKGHFPHLFNSAENYGYKGPLPEKKFYDLAFMISSEKAKSEFDAWYAKEARDKPVWDFAAELRDYCVNDVLVLSHLVRAYHDIILDTINTSPWCSPTAPSMVHKSLKQALSTGLDLPARDNDLFHEELAKATRNHWAILRGNEYWFARAALRGGRTDVRTLLHTVSDADWARGVRIRYQDIVSMYPYVQVAAECAYPVGLPLIRVWDSKTYPCFKHTNPYGCANYIKPWCSCRIADKRHQLDPKLDVKEEARQPTPAEICSDKTFFGIVCASLNPPTDMFHPVLVVWDETAKKCIGSLQPIRYGVFTSVEFKKALEKGYELVELHRLDMYKARPGLWNDFIKDLYVLKMANSEATPAAEVQTQLCAAYTAKFGADMGTAISKSFPSWGFNAAKRQVFKIILNSVWGKHCQRPVMSQMQVIDNHDFAAYDGLLNNVMDNCVQLDSFIEVGNNLIVRSTPQGHTTHPNLHDSYLPAGLFVPAYGRLMLYAQLEKLGQRALYNDTDSVIYRYAAL